MPEPLNSLFCALVYHPEEQSPPSEDAVIALFTLEARFGHLEIRVRTRWEEIVRSADRGEMRSLLEDFKKRSAIDPPLLFKQVSSLSVGPLIAREVVSNIKAVPLLAEFLVNSTTL